MLLLFPGRLAGSSSSVHNFYGVLQLTSHQLSQRLLTDPIPAQGRYFIHGTAILADWSLTLETGAQFIVAETGSLRFQESFRLYQRSGSSFFFHNYGEIIVSETNGVHIHAPFQNYGTLRIASGTLNTYSFNSAGEIHFGATGRLRFNEDANLMASSSIHGPATLECSDDTNVVISSQSVEIEELELTSSCSMTFDNGVNFSAPITRIDARGSSALTIRQQADVLAVTNLAIRDGAAMHIETQANIARYAYYVESSAEPVCYRHKSK